MGTKTLVFLAFFSLFVLAGCELVAVLDQEIDAAIRAKDPDMCEELDDRRVDRCLAMVAKAMGDTSVCQRIHGAGAINSCIIDIAADKKDIDICNEMEGTPYVLCVQAVAVEAKRPAHCARIDPEEYPFDHQKCLSDTAIEIGDASYCQEVNDPRHRNNCYLHIGLRNRDHELCDQISVENLEDQCNRQIAFSTLNPSLCARIISDRERDNCYESISRSTKDPLLCELITNEVSKERCLRNI